MSTDIYDLKAQEYDKIRTAVANDDHLTLYFMANLAQGKEDFEQAEYLLKLARKAQENDEACNDCGGTGEVTTMELDTDSMRYQPVGTMACPTCKQDERWEQDTQDQ